MKRCVPIPNKMEAFLRVLSISNKQASGGVRIMHQTWASQNRTICFGTLQLSNIYKLCIWTSYIYRAFHCGPCIDFLCNSDLSRSGCSTNCRFVSSRLSHSMFARFTRVFPHEVSWPLINTRIRIVRSCSPIKVGLFGLHVRNWNLGDLLNTWPSNAWIRTTDHVG